MVIRHFWLGRIEDAWRRRNVVWLSGVRRTGKTFLCQSIPGVEYFDCELPRTRAMMEDPETFLKDHRGRRIVLDEIHRLGNPSELLKIAADYFASTKVIATGSSVLGASAKFRDTLAGRKAEIWLTPMMSADLQDFGQQNLQHRFFHGGLPPFFLSAHFPERDIQEWVDAYWAKDIQELFRLERRSSFEKFVELLITQSGGMFEATRFSRPCEVSRTTVMNYLRVLEATLVVHIVRPFTSHRATEIVSAPKVYSFDTGFLCYYRGWHDLRREDRGILWEHYVLNEIHAFMQTRTVQYWRDKQGHEVDFVYTRRGRAPIAIECKWSARDFNPANLLAFWKLYPKATLCVVAQDVDRPYSKQVSGMAVSFLNLSGLISLLSP